MLDQGGNAFRPRRRLKVIALGVAVLTVIGGIGGELVARYIVGLGDPPLFVLDPDCEYLLVASRAYRRFGNGFDVNAYSMRSAEFPRAKSSADELRVLVVGDSIVNGGPRVDQAELGTERMRVSLAKRLGRAVTVGNASAGSWGPPNELAYIRKFGVFGADVVLLVLNSEDWGDVPGLEGIGVDWPKRRPVLALQEVFDKVLLKALGRALGRPLGPQPLRKPEPEKDREETLGAVRAFVDTARAAGAKVVLVQHLKRGEVGGDPGEGYRRFRALAESMGVPVYSSRDSFAASAAAGVDPYRRGDEIHANGEGQRLLGELFERAVIDSLGPRAPVESGPAGG